MPYRNGWQLAVEEVNASGGLLGRKVEVISRDDAGKPDDAIRLATELVSNEKVALQRRIEVTDRQIDQLVYELYGLTAEEIAVVESNG